MKSISKIYKKLAARAHKETPSGTVRSAAQLWCRAGFPKFLRFGAALFGVRAAAASPHCVLPFHFKMTFIEKCWKAIASCRASPKKTYFSESTNVRKC